MSDDGAPEGAPETPPDFDPLLAQAERLPSFIKGAEGNDPSKHVRPADGDKGVDDEVIDDGFGYEPPDPSQFTGD